MAKNGCSKFSTNFSQKDWYKFRMAKKAYTEFIETSLVQKDWKKFELPKMGILNLFKSVTVSNGLESNEICNGK